MRKIKNCESKINKLLALIVSEKLTPILDLDEVLLCAKERQRLYDQSDVINKRITPDRIGQLDLDHYVINSTKSNIAKDKNLPLIGLVHALNDLDIDYHVSSARIICSHTEKLLTDRKINPRIAMGRGFFADYRKDHILKTDHLIRHFDTVAQRKKLILIDDNRANCEAFIRLGAHAVQVVVS